MKTRNTNSEGSVRQRIYRKLFHDTPTSLSLDASLPTNQGLAIAHIKLYRRGERCEVPENCEYLIAVAYGMDTNGDWLPRQVETAQTYSVLKEALRKIASTADCVVIQGSEHFDPLAQELGFHHITSEWGKL